MTFVAILAQAMQPIQPLGINSLLRFSSFWSEHNRTPSSATGTHASCGVLTVACNTAAQLVNIFLSHPNTLEPLEGKGCPVSTVGSPRATAR